MHKIRIQSRTWGDAGDLKYRHSYKWQWAYLDCEADSFPFDPALQLTL